MSKYGMVIDLNRCVGCFTCAVGCKMQNNVPMGMLWNRVLSEGSEEIDGVRGVYPYLGKSYRPVACQHCENAPCVKVCPVAATYKAEDGRVLVDYDRCIGCRYCMAACPYNVRVFNWEKPVREPSFNYGDKDVPARKVGVVEKCSLCKERAEKGLEPFCITVCPARARKYGDLDEPDSEVSRLIRERGGEQMQKEIGTNPQVYYIR